MMRRSTLKNTIGTYYTSTCLSKFIAWRRMASSTLMIITRHLLEMRQAMMSGWPALTFTAVALSMIHSGKNTMRAMVCKKKI